MADVYIKSELGVGGGKTKVCPSKNGIFKNWKYNLFLKIRNRNA